MSTSNEDIANKYFFIEYIIGRVADLLSIATKRYITDKDPIEKSHLHEERRRVEYLKKCDEFVTEKNVWFNDLTNQEGESGEVSESVGVNINLLKSLDDNGEAEMAAKLELMGLGESVSEGTQTSTGEEAKAAEDSKEALRPVPDFRQLQEEAKAQQLKISEFFWGDPSSVKAKRMKELRVDEEEMAKDEGAFSGHSFRLKGPEDVDIVRVLPTVDSQSQMEIRRKIFHEKLIK